jgi:CMP/dCMP kinase
VSAGSFIVAVDGPAGAGKSTVSKLLARRLSFALVDTGAIYRCVALSAQREGIALDDDEKLASLLGRVQISFSGEDRVLLGSEDVSQAIRTPEVSMGASQVSSRPIVRSGLLQLQRRLALASPNGAILEGRDIGTVVFPDAPAKFFLDAGAETRARRRYEELFQRGVETSINQVLDDQTQRDRNDASREVAPLKPADDAVIIDSTAMPVSDVVQTIERIVRERMAARGAPKQG